MKSPFKILRNGDNKLIDDQRVNPPFKAVSCGDNKLVGDEAAATVKLLTKLNS
jgi:hypothetical protein